jgi:hypothetical protein
MVISFRPTFIMPPVAYAGNLVSDGDYCDSFGYAIQGEISQGSEIAIGGGRKDLKTSRLKGETQD